MKRTHTYLESTYGPQEQKTFFGALMAFFGSEFPQMAGDRARRAVVQGIVELVARFFPETTHLQPGQTPWVTVAKNVRSSYGKTIAETELVPVILSVLRVDEASARKQGLKIRDLKIEAVARLCQEADQQGGCLTAAELALLLKTTPPTIGKYIKHWENEHGTLLPRRGTIHDLGPTLTHKREICRLLFLEGRTVQDTCQRTKHSPQAVHRYITNFKQVFTCKTKGLTTTETAFATKISTPLVEEYHRLFDEYAVTHPQIDALLNGARSQT